MQIQKITNNKIKVVVNLKTIDKIFSSNEISFNSFKENSSINKLFYKILLQAQKYYNFKTNNCDLILQNIDINCDDIIFIITRIPKYIQNVKPKKRYSRNKYITKDNKSCNLRLNLYQFKSCDLFLDFCNNIKNSIDFKNLNANKNKYFKILFFNNTYYLYFNKFSKNSNNINITNIYTNDFLSILSKYSTNMYCSDIYISKILEHGKVLFTSNKFQKYIQYIQ